MRYTADQCFAGIAQCTCVRPRVCLSDAVSVVCGGRELGEQLADTQRQLALSLASRSELEDMVLAARVAKLDTEKQLADQRQRLAEQDEEKLRAEEQAAHNKVELENANGATFAAAVARTHMLKSAPLHLAIIHGHEAAPVVTF